MTERPILFSGPMVRAILAGSKTQTRRVLKYEWHHGCMTGDCPHSYQKDCDASLQEYANTECPYGVPGDRLWVRETFALPANPVKSGPVYYEADKHFFMGQKFAFEKLRPSIFLPRWASRIMLEIQSVRIERLQQILEADAKAEGVEWYGFADLRPDGELRDGPSIAYRASFHDLWDSINGKKHPWSSNPWIWAITFKRIEG